MDLARVFYNVLKVGGDAKPHQTPKPKGIPSFLEKVSSTPNWSFMMALFRVLFCLFVVAMAVSEAAHVLSKRSFTQLGCMGDFDRSKFARLDSVCEECYELYREPDIHFQCRENCFKNAYFSKCVDALLLTSEQEELDNSVRQLYGKRK
ncbi:ion transport peptide-like [Caerostris darwini]|uniref:Ion transport peptide-like n=1 Tax=Caerostris darwini TaxID=1538125 RepID=A0AAV4QK44_9ARAC|nr:ion transport peptide-like [Caerostris darwini]